MGAMSDGQKVYAVFKQGVYRQECGGIFSTLEKAILAANGLAAGDVDEYHTYDVIGFDIDKQSEQLGPGEERGWYSHGDVFDPEIVYRCRNVDGVATKCH